MQEWGFAKFVPEQEIQWLVMKGRMIESEALDNVIAQRKQEKEQRRTEGNQKKAKGS